MSRIAESELIINPRGAIYHLDLRPDEIAGTVITVGDPDRVKEVSKHFDSIEIKRQHREFISHTGYVGTKRLTVLSSGIGPDNIDIVLNELDALVNIDFETIRCFPGVLDRPVRCRPQCRAYVFTIEFCLAYECFNAALRRSHGEALRSRVPQERLCFS